MGLAPEPAVTPVREEDKEEVRIAVVMTGGVSLAVWMGGVTTELNRLRREEGPYGQLLDLLAVSARVDVIAGTSAGGLNGVLLAVGIAHDRSLDGLKDLWFKHGSLEALFRSPVKRDLPSLLKGDDYFLPKIREALGELVGNTAPNRRQHDEPLHLIVTGSLLRPKTEGFIDDLGTVVQDVNHAGLFSFRRGGSDQHEHSRCPSEKQPSAPGHDEHKVARDAGDDFRDTLILDRLALAARSTASFPIAFEPSFCPVDETTRRPKRPDMRCYANFEKSKFVMDGGVLMNKPLRPALHAIHEQPAAAQVRRVLLYVVPDPGETVIESADLAAEVPTMARVGLDSLITLPRNESIANELREIAAQNRRAAQSRRRRQFWLSQTADSPEGRASQLEEQASRLYDEYKELRARSSVDHILQDVTRGLTSASDSTSSELWNRSVIEQALRKVRKRYLPDEFPQLLDEQDLWDWGFASVEHAGNVAIDLLQQALRMTNPRNEEAADARAKVRAQRAWLHGTLRLYRAVRSATEEHFWRKQAAEMRTLGLFEAQAPTEDFRDWAIDAFKQWPGDPDRPEVLNAESGEDNATALRRELGRLALLIATALVEAGPEVKKLTDHALPSKKQKEAKKLWLMFQTLLAGGPEQDSNRTCLRRLLALEVVDTALGGREDSIEQLVELVQVSADAPNCFDGRQTAEQKLSGLQLAHFGAFYKTSWRANDWMWGRLDGAFRLCQMLLDPARLRQLFEGESQYVLDQLEAIALAKSEADEQYTKLLETEPARGWDRPAATHELQFLDDTTLPVPQSLPVCARGVARRIQLEILRTELVGLSDAIALDETSGAYESPEARTFKDAVDREPKTIGPSGPRLDPQTTVRLFPKADVGAERINAEIGSDQFTATASTAAAVTVSAMGGSKSGLGALRGLVQTLRGLVLAIYVLAQSAVRQGRTSFALQTFVLALGAVLLATATLMDDPPKSIMTGAVILLGAGFIHAALRSGTLASLIPIAIGTAVAIAPWLLLEAVRKDEADPPEWHEWLEASRPVFIVIGVFVALALLGLTRRRR